MVNLSIVNQTLVVRVKGLHKLWAFKNRIEVPLSHVKGVHAEAAAAKSASKGIRIRAPGTHIPWVITAGTYYKRSEREFWDVRDPAKGIVIDLADGRYDRLVVEVADPMAAVKLVEDALAIHRAPSSAGRTSR